MKHVSVLSPGLGPRFKSNNCSSCHAQPNFGGTGPRVNQQFKFTNPSNGVAPGNITPPFLTADGPSVEARFPYFFNPNGTVNYNAPNGGVEDLFTITGRSDAGTCNSASILPQPNFAAAQAANNVILRIPTPVFGAGLVENLDDGGGAFGDRRFQCQDDRVRYRVGQLGALQTTLLSNST